MTHDSPGEGSPGPGPDGETTPEKPSTQPTQPLPGASPWPSPSPWPAPSPWAQPTEPVPPPEPPAQPTEPAAPGMWPQSHGAAAQPGQAGAWVPPTVPVAQGPYQPPGQGPYQPSPGPYQQGYQPGREWPPQGPRVPQGPWGQQPQPPGWPAPPRPAAPRPASYPQPTRIEVLPDAPFGLAILPAPVTTSGVAVGSMAAGIGSLLVSGVVWCFGLMGAEEGWGGLVGGAFCVLAVLLGIGAIGLGWAGLRQIRRGGAGKGRGFAITGIICGGAGILLAAAGVVVAIVMAGSAASDT